MRQDKDTGHQCFLLQSTALSSTSCRDVCVTYHGVSFVVGHVDAGLDFGASEIGAPAEPHPLSLELDANTDRRHDECAIVAASLPEVRRLVRHVGCYMRECLILQSRSAG